MLGFRKPRTVYAHCDIPCGIYDPHQAQLAALTVIRMMDLIAESKNAHDTARYTSVKEEHTESCKREVRIIWGGYFKEEHFKKHPELSDLVHEIMELGSGARQGKDRGVAEDLLKAVNRLAEIYWDTKGVKTKTVKTPYKPEEEVVYPIL